MTPLCLQLDCMYVGVQRFGTHAGSWLTMLMQLPFHPSRTASDIRDQWAAAVCMQRRVDVVAAVTGAVRSLFLRKKDRRAAVLAARARRQASRPQSGATAAAAVSPVAAGSQSTVTATAATAPAAVSAAASTSAAAVASPVAEEDRDGSAASDNTDDEDPYADIADDVLSGPLFVSPRPAIDDVVNELAQAPCSVEAYEKVWRRVLVLSGCVFEWPQRCCCGGIVAASMLLRCGTSPAADRDERVRRQRHARRLVGV